ncbi:cell division protein ZapA [Putridiphycobacter roseus]|uniref:Cell division protein ZapA n=1 Tax=Putridiphycobacter roseus TaxID=2219161 RepID=A0A2W1N0L2_9FLAO|nr:cell division protein ZapA [Putridiphycobacter roseus]PZE16481.1 cell division protein ZapA [Putridiphycobacter roseus]
MEKVSLKVIIAGRTYPLTIKKEEEGAIMQAAEKINTNIKKLQGNYAVKDMQDLLAMTTLQFAVQANGSTAPSASIDPSFEEDLNRILEKINTQL